jgi:hypothetical protein
VAVFQIRAILWSQDLIGLIFSLQIGLCQGKSEDFYVWLRRRNTKSRISAAIFENEKFKELNARPCIERNTCQVCIWFYGSLGVMSMALDDQSNVPQYLQVRLGAGDSNGIP